MDELVFLKLGGSLLTDKTQEQALRPVVLARLASEVAAAVARRPDLGLVIGHGSGSFGHVTARKYRTRDGVATQAEWRGYAETACVAARLNRLVADALWSAGVPVLPIQPSASARCYDGELQNLDDRPIRTALAHGVAPLLYGDVALDGVRGGTIVSTEQLFAWLAARLAPQRIILVGEVEGVFTADPTRDPGAVLTEELTPTTLAAQAVALGSSRGVDVTGGMAAKVAEMFALLAAVRDLAAVQIISGLAPGLVQAVLLDPAYRAGTRLTV